MGLLIIVFSTVTTTFLDAYSAGVSSVSISSKIKEKWAAIVVTVIGTVAAIVYPMDNITNFCICPDDCSADCRLFHFKESRCWGIHISVEKSCGVAGRFCIVPGADACGYTGWKYAAGYGDYRNCLCDCRENCSSSKRKIRCYGRKEVFYLWE